MKERIYSKFPEFWFSPFFVKHGHIYLELDAKKTQNYQKSVGSNDIFDKNGVKIHLLDLHFLDDKNHYFWRMNEIGKVLRQFLPEKGVESGLLTIKMLYEMGFWRRKVH